MNKQVRYAPGFRGRAVRMVRDHHGDYESQWAAINSIAAKVGRTGETLRKWVRQIERDLGTRDVITSFERDRPKELEREIRALQRANGILRKASAYFSQAE